ncbi:HepT-like ribonuclease domain-containing protein [Sinomonas sp. ASV322]|uniref:HepT-like ribonuclease domain-containing protein n=1 Tax=Sinomonas sp. ASV322 TaxID=3041920 RepID=UPI0027DBF16B|nr:HepT-like ribonuclease domain-containing protein [Sinomonas sp. ASV322]MDQ4501710.1 DUF86 domain-containing protein [Sinomonas sp. ASV322]
MTGLDRSRIDGSLRDLLRLSDTAANAIVARGKEAYDADIALRLAAESILHKIGEAVARLPGEFILANPHVSWRAMKATRNLVAHNHDQVDCDILWNALANRLPLEAQHIREILEARPTSR